MPDYDVGVVALSSPPPSAAITAYRPAVSVRNNGIHDALAVGSLRIYSAGLVIFTTELYSATISPGNTDDALAVDYWTPLAVGRYMVLADVTCTNDQLETNNHLPPTWITVGPQPPPPAPEVPLHAAQHEDGGPDEVIIDGLHGRTADPQTALAHKTSHQAAGADALDLTGLHGVLADGQPIADHHATHEDGGTDQLNVDGLHGQLFNVQKPDVHDNSAHDPNYSVNKHGSADHTVQYATDADLDTHKLKTQVHGCDPYHVLSDFHTTVDDAPHDDATNLEKTANKDQANGYPSLDQYVHVPPAQLGIWTTPPPANDKALLANGTWDYPKPAEHGAAQHDDTVASRTGTDRLVPSNQLGLIGVTPPPAEYVLRADQTWGAPGGAATPQSIAKTAYHLPVPGNALETTLLSQSLPATMAVDNLVIHSKVCGTIQPGPGTFQIFLCQDGVHKIDMLIPCSLTETTTFQLDFMTIFYPSTPDSARSSARLIYSRPIAGVVTGISGPSSWYGRPAAAFVESISVLPASALTTLMYPEENYQIAIAGQAS